MLRRLYQFFSSLKLAVLSILLLSSVLALATFVGSYYGMRASQIVVYQRWWFYGVLFLLGLNVLCAALIRFPWKQKQTGFVLTHLGIIVILFGSFLTQQFGLDGNMPIPEKQQSNEVILNELKLTLRDQNSGKVQVVSVPESHRSQEGNLLEVNFGSDEKLVVEKFIPRAIPENKMIESPVKGLGAPALKIGLTNDRFQIEEWLKIDPKTFKSELNLGPAIVNFEKLLTAEDEKNFFMKKSIAEKPKEKDKGRILVERNGERLALKISDLIGKSRRLESVGLEVQIKRYLPYAVVDGNRLISKSEEPVNPAVEVILKDLSDPQKTEEYTLFALFPEFNTMHQKKASSKEKLDVKLSMQLVRDTENLMGVGKSRGRLFLAQSADNSKLLYRVLASSGAVNSEGELEIGKKIPTGWMNIELEAKEWIPSAVLDEEPRSVDLLQGADEPFLTAIRVKVGKRPSFWLLEGMGKSISVLGSDLLVQYHRDRMNLPFQIYLEKFTMGTNPGTNTAASFISDVVVKDPKESAEKKAVISMNEPLKHGGYTFYQASYQLSPVNLQFQCLQ